MLRAAAAVPVAVAVFAVAEAAVALVPAVEALPAAAQRRPDWCARVQQRHESYRAALALESRAQCRCAPARTWAQAPELA